MLITKLGQHQIILGKPWMKKHGAVLDMRNDQLSFWPGHYQHDDALKLPPAEPYAEKPCAQHTKKLNEKSKAEEPRAEEPRTESPQAAELHASRPVEILKQTTNERPELLPYLLPSTRGVSKVANTPETVEPGKKKKPSTIPRKLKPNAKDETNTKNEKPSVERADSKPLNLAFIGGAPFVHLVKSKNQKAKIFAISMRDIEYQLNKRTKPPTNPKTVVPAEYHDFLDVFSKDISDTLRPYGKYDHKIELLKDKDLSDLGHSALRGMSVPQLKFVKKFLEENLKKGFIEASSALCSSPILLTKKPGGGIRFCVDYRKLNSLTKKDAYPLPLIAETIARLKKAVIFTKIDIRQAFHKLCMAVESKDATTFASRFGAYKWKVMPFGLTGGPASWQRFINDLLWEYLNEFCTAYLDDILIYSTSMKDHKQHVRKVLTKLREAGIQADVDKCEFHVTETKYLGLIISTDGIKMDPSKVDAIKSWDTPTCVKEVRSFIGFCNFYRQFIRDFSKIAGPLNTLTKKDVEFTWTKECELAFKGLKQRVCEAPILIYFDPSKECHVETDLSDYVSAGVLSQEDDNGILHPVAYFSKRIVPAECNYEIYDKELLAIIQCFEEWRPELEGTAMPVRVLTDHKDLEYFMMTKKLTPRQARWAEFLSKFNFKVTYQTGKKNEKADALTRKPNDRLINDEDYEHRMQVLLPPERIEIQPIEVTNKPEVEHEEEAEELARSHSAEPSNKPQPAKGSVEAEDPREEVTDHAKATRDEGVKIDNDEPEEEAKEAERAEGAEKLAKSHAAEPQAEPHAKPEKETDETLPERVKISNRNDVLFKEIREYLANPADHDRPTDVYLRGSRAANGLLYKDNKLWVADDLRLDVIREVHDQPAVGHAGVRRTMLLIQQHFFWPRMKRDVDRYIRNCHVCRQAKAPRD